MIKLSNRFANLEEEGVSKEKDEKEYFSNGQNREVLPKDQTEEIQLQTHKNQKDQIRQ